MIGLGGNPGFGVTFSIMQIMVPVMFVLVFGIIIVTMVRGVGEWNKKQPITEADGSCHCCSEAVGCT